MVKYNLLGCRLFERGSLRCKVSPGYMPLPLVILCLSAIPQVLGSFCLKKTSRAVSTDYVYLRSNIMTSLHI